MAEECGLVYHNDIHSVNTLISLNTCVLYVCVAICALFIFVYIFLFMAKINGGSLESLKCKSIVISHDECISSDDEICRSFVCFD